jgi:hypothetical protein
MWVRWSLPWCRAWMMTTAEVQPHKAAVSLLVDCVFGRDPLRSFDQLVAAADSVLPQNGHRRRRVPLAYLRLGARQPAQVTLLGREQMQKRGGDRPVRAWSRQLKLIVGQLRADVQQV